MIPRALPGPRKLKSFLLADFRNTSQHSCPHALSSIMGIDTFSAKFLMSESRRGVAFERLLTLGRQSIYMERGAYRALITAAGGSAREENYADDLFRALGAAEIDVMDTSHRTRATNT